VDEPRKGCWTVINYTGKARKPKLSDSPATVIIDAKRAKGEGDHMCTGIGFRRPP
jgi:hypothetical protein